MVRVSLIFMFVFMSSPLAISVSKSLNTNILKNGSDNMISVPKIITSKEKTIDSLSNWHVANASYYDSMDTTQTGNGSGIGAFGRKIESRFFR